MQINVSDVFYSLKCHQYVPGDITTIMMMIIIIISFMQGIYTYIPETNYVPREYSVAATLLFLFMVFISLVSVLNLLYFYITTFRSMCPVPNMAVFCSSSSSSYYYYYYKTIKVQMLCCVAATPSQLKTIIISIENIKIIIV